MNGFNEELYEVVIGMVQDLHDVGEEEYQIIRCCLLAQTANNPNLRKFVNKLFAYADAHRPRKICMSGSS